MIINWKDIAIRAGKTFVQGASAAVGGLFVLTEMIEPGAISLEPIRIWAYGAGIGGLSAVISWAWNALVGWANS